MTVTKKLFGLGKGLGSLIPETAARVAKDGVKENIFYVEVTKIRANPDQPRTDFDEEQLAELAKSIRRYGVLQPLLVSKVQEESSRGMNVYYQLIAGERRWRASQMAGLPHVPVIIRDDMQHDQSRRLEMSLIENVQRADLNPMEEAEAFVKLAGEFGLTQKEIADKVAKSREAVANTMRLVKLPGFIKDALRAGRITNAHARALLAFDSPKKQEEMYNQILKGGMSTKDVETVASNAKPSAKHKLEPRFVDLQENLAKHLAAPVIIKSGPKGGQIVIRFATLEDLNVVAKRIID